MRFASIISLLPFLGLTAAAPTLYGRQQNPNEVVFHLDKDYKPEEIMTWEWRTLHDPTEGFTNYVGWDYRTADNPKGLATVENGELVLKSANTSNPRGRDSVRLHSNDYFTGDYMMVFDITHMPAGKGVFPAVWTNNEKLGKWPEGGEIDIIEGSGNRNFNQMTLHVLDSCPLDVTQSKGDPSFQYNNKAPDCSKGSGWCGVLAPTTVSNAYGAGFNAGGGGQYILVRRNDEIVIYFIPRVLNYYIEDEYGMDTFNGWLQSIGAVQARFKSSPSCNLSKQIYDQSIIINTAFCGGLGNVDFDGDMQACMDYHMHADESAYTEAYWSIKGIKVFRPVGPSDSEPVQPVTFRGQYEYDYIDKNPSPWDGVPGPSASKDSFPGPLWTPGTDRPDGFTYPYSNGWTLGGPAPNYAPRPDPIPASPPVPASPAQPKKKNKAEEAKKEPAMNIGLMNMAVVEPPVDPVAAAATPAVAPQASHPVDPLHAPAPSVPDASTPPMPIAAAPVPDASVPPMPIAAAPVPDASVPPMPAPAATGSDNSGAVYAK